MLTLFRSKYGVSQKYYGKKKQTNKKNRFKVLVVPISIGGRQTLRLFEERVTL